MSDKITIPKHWEIKTLGEVCQLKNGYAFKSNYYEAVGVPVIRISDINGGVVSSNKAVRVSPNKDYENYLVENNDILVAMSGATTGKFGIYKSLEKAYQNQRVGKFKILDETILNNQFLFHQINSLKKQIEKDAYGGAQPNISSTKIEQMLIALPPLPEQQAIVSKIEELLSDLEKGKQQLQTALQQLKTYRQSLLKWAFNGKLTNPDVEEGDLPKGWKWVLFGELFSGTPQNGLYKPSTQYGSGIPIIRIDGFYEGVILNDYDYKRVLLTEEETKRYLLVIDDILVNRVNSMSHLGKCGLVKTLKEQTVFESNIMRIKITKELALPKFVTCYLSSSKGIKELTKNAKHAVNQASINQTDVSNAVIPLPPLEEQQRIVEELESKLTVCDNIEATISQSLQQAETLRQSILKQAFEGKLIEAVAETREAKVIPLYKPRSEYFYQMQLLGLIATLSKLNNIPHGEMTLAKYAYFLDRIYKIPTYYNYKRLHLGPFPPEMKKTINNKQYFKKSQGEIEVVNGAALFKSPNHYQQQIENAVHELTGIFSTFASKDRSHKTELLATVCKVIEDIQTTDLNAVRMSMVEWEIELIGEIYRTKAEKFTEAETDKCLKFIIDRGWDKKLLKNL